MEHLSSHKDSEISLEYIPCLNLATLRANLGPVFSVEMSGGAESSTRIELSIPEIQYQETVVLSGGRKRPKTRRTRDMEEALNRVVRPLHVYLRTQADGDALEEIHVSILPAWYWPHHLEARLSVSALVLPGHDRVSQVVAESFFRAKAGLGVASIEHLLTRDGMSSIPKMIFDYLANEWEILYTKPRVEMDEWCGGSYQPVLGPEKVLRGDRGQRGEGNCLDLSLLFAGALETVGMKPVLIFSGEASDAPEHVVVGWWTDHGQRFRPILDDPAYLRQKVEKGELQVLDVTGVCLDPHRLGYLDAVKVAKEGLGGPVHAVDVCAGRQPFGEVGSLILENNPIVQRAIWAGQEFMEESQAAQRQTAHILYGLCKVGGEGTTWLLSFAGGSVREVLSTIERSLPHGRESDHAITTKNYEVCLSSARLNAHGRGSQSIEEEDLLWGVVENPSGNIRKILEASGCEWNLLLRGLTIRTQPARGTMVYNVIPTPSKQDDLIAVRETPDAGE